MFKKSKTTTRSKTLAITLLFVSGFGLQAQSIYNQPERIKEIVQKKDSLFWKAYNACNIDQMMTFLSEDFEFYHDKNGLTKGLVDFKKGLSNGLCANGPQLRRVAKEGSVEVFPMNNLGAIIKGEHYFYIGDKADGLAKFNHIWTFKNDQWKMSRVLSFDHQPVPYENKKTSISLDDALLTSYAGKYVAPQTGEVTFSKQGKNLQMKAGPMELFLLAEKTNLFFHKESSLTFEFISNSNQEVIKVIIRENGNIVEEAKRL